MREGRQSLLPSLLTLEHSGLCFEPPAADTWLCSTFNSNTLIKVTDDTAVVGLILGNNEKAYWMEGEDLTPWSQDTNLLLNVRKTKELIVDFGKKTGTTLPLISTSP